jgi:protein disulfide-isomerase
MRIIRVLSAALAAFALTASALADREPWTENYAQALDKARKEKKMVLMSFVASESSAQCKKQEDEVFSKPEFKDYAAKNLVLLELDFPKTKEQTNEVKEQNRTLNGQYNVRQFPTIVLLSSAGEVVTRFTGYGGGGAAKMIEKIELFRK